MSLPDPSLLSPTPSGEPEPSNPPPPSGASDSSWIDAPITDAGDDDALPPGEGEDPHASLLDDASKVPDPPAPAADVEARAEKAAEAEPVAEEKQAEPAPEASPAEAKPAEPPAKELPPPPEWKSVDDIDPAAVPEAVRPWFDLFVRTTEPEVIRAREAQAEADAVSARLREAIAQITDDKGKVVANADALAEYVTKTAGYAAEAATREANMARAYFTATQQDFDAAPPNVRTAFLNGLKAGAHAKHSGEHLGDQLVEYWRYTKFTHNWSPKPAAPPPPAPVATPAAPPAPAKPTAAQRDAAVSGGRTPAVSKSTAGPSYTQTGAFDVDATLAADAHLLRK